MSPAWQEWQREHSAARELSTQVQEALEKGLLSIGHAKVLLGIRATSVQNEFLEEIVRKGLSVREVEKRVRSQSTSPALKPAPTPQEPQPAWVTTLETKMRTRLGTKVTIRNHPDRYQGEIVLQYYDREGLERLVAQLVEDQALV